MKAKKIPEPGQIRQVPEHFSWVDHRIIRNHRLQGSPVGSWALYLFLLTVGDSEGLSYYSVKSICERTCMDEDELGAALRDLIQRNLVAYQAPFFQVLEVGNRMGGQAG
jgi:hypothetical protein